MKAYTIRKKGALNYVCFDSAPERRRAWSGDRVAFAYDALMRRMVFPNTLNADPEAHSAILRKLLAAVHGCCVLELATGSGSAVEFLPPDNVYTGTDISPRLLKRAVRKFKRAGFEEPVFHVVGADQLVFDAQAFDLCLCILALNFFPDLAPVLDGLARVLVPGGRFVGVVPVPERGPEKGRISGTLRSQEELATQFAHGGFSVEPLNHDNGSLFYFQAVKR